MSPDGNFLFANCSLVSSKMSSSHCLKISYMITQPHQKDIHFIIHIFYILCDSYFTGPGGHRIANIAQEPLLHHVHHHLQSGGLKDGRLSAKINIQFRFISVVTIAPLSCRALSSHSVDRLGENTRGVDLKWKTSWL